MPNKIPVRIGDTINNWTIISESNKKTSAGCTIVLAKCICGNEKEVEYPNIIRGTSKSCGCGISKIKRNFILGERHEMLTFIEEIPHKENIERSIKVKCDCGNEKVILACTFDKSKSCGCIQYDAIKKISLKHGDCIGKNSVEYSAWLAMRNRCYNPKNEKYYRYGARGIVVCDWFKNSFENFLDDMGRRPTKKHSNDRINNDGNYSCGHCDECIQNGWKANTHWATSREQSLNNSNNHLIEHLGETKTILEWSEIYKMSYGTFWHRLKNCEFNLDIYNFKWKHDFLYLKEAV
jgi:hypothetical protein